MIPATNVRTVKTSGLVASAEFNISLDDSAHIMTILRDTLYSDKIMAVLREYSANAWDAHREAGKGDLPISVKLPTAMDPNLTIRDFGPGLSRDQVFNVYTQYGRSTKRNSSEAVGMLGIGSKSGFAYAESFVVTSYHGGTKSVYVAALDESDKGVINLLHEEPCGEETGIGIQLAISPHDIHTFHDRARKLYKYFVPRPNVNTDVPTLPTEQANLRAGVIFPEGNEWVARMGCVAYRVDMSQIEDNLPGFIRSIGGCLYFGIGEVHINASREELKYSDRTKELLVERINSLVDEYVEDTLTKVAAEKDLTDWGKRLRLQTLGKFYSAISKDGDLKEYLSAYVSLKEKPKTFRLFKKRETLTTIRVGECTRILVRDDARTLRGYLIQPTGDLVLRKANRNDLADGVKPPTWDEVNKELDEVLKENKLVGIPILKLSEMPWNPPLQARTNKVGNVKHKLKLFRFTPQRSYASGAKSDDWTAEEHAPTDDDVYIEIHGFIPLGGRSLFSAYKKDVELATFMGVSMPPVYGYKVTEKDGSKPRQGTEYFEWRKKFVTDLIKSPAFRERWESWRWAYEEEYGFCGQADGAFSSYRSRHEIWNPREIEFLQAQIGETHPICVFLQTAKLQKMYHELGMRSVNSHSNGTSVMIDMTHEFPEILDVTKSNVMSHWDAVRSEYKLLGIPEVTMNALRSRNMQTREKWIEYVKMVDETKGKGIKP